MKQPLVSIITPSYQSFRFISETIESVKNQDYPHIEHIVVDGNSDDGTLEILKSYRHLTWISEPDNGQSHALNKGFRMAGGEIIGWLNTDDTYNPGAISTAVRFLMQNQNIDMVYSDQRIVDEQGFPITIRKSKPFDLYKMFTENLIRQSTVFIRKYVIDNLGGVDENLHYCMDREFWLRISRHYKLQYIPNIVSTNFRFCAGTKSYSDNHSFHTEWEGVLERAITDPSYRDVPLEHKRKAIQQARVRFTVANIERALKSKDLKMLSVQLFALVTDHWGYILNYPIKKINELRNL